MTKLIFENHKSKIYDYGNKIVKEGINPYRKNILKHLQKLNEFDNRIVKLYSWDKTTITMEKINIKYSLFEYVESFDESFSDFKLNNYISEYIDIWNNFFQFSFKHFDQDQIIFHEDYRLTNVVVDQDDNLRVIDPEGFKIRSYNCTLEPGLFFDNLIRLHETRRRYKRFVDK